MNDTGTATLTITDTDGQVFSFDMRRVRYTTAMREASRLAQAPDVVDVDVNFVINTLSLRKETRKAS